MKLCDVDGCQKPARTKTAALCKMHYHRQYRHGDVNKVATESGITASHGRRYTRTYNPTHPLANKNGSVYTHRMVLFDHIGYGPHACHWCGTPVDWAPRGTPGELQPDHLNNQGDDNRIDNLVPACRTCNTARGGQRRAAALRDAGWWKEHDTIARLRAGGRTAPVTQRRRVA